ncbi:hypothetical protein U9M48_029121 [Paspalum notatum var. saurae]|uniref:Uncharacterized protein n=1 Tax=Paspalum notatum var. saurae TaxID=547442 RepID=A0AAQ3TWV4_PASNO
MGRGRDAARSGRWTRVNDPQQAENGPRRQIGPAEKGGAEIGHRPPRGPSRGNRADRTGRAHLIQNSEPEHQEDDPEDPEYLPEENTDEQDSGDDEPDNIVTRDDWYED